MANNLTHFDMLTKHNPVKSENCAAVLSVLLQELENKFQDCQKFIHFFVSLQLHFPMT